MNYIITRNKEFFQKIGDYNYCNLGKLGSLPKLIAFDTETTSLFPRLGYLFSIQIGTGEDNYIIDLQHHKEPGKTIKFEEVTPYIRDKNLVGHNLTFDLGWCYKYGFYPKGKTYDTFIASKILHNGKTDIYSHSFGNVMDRELKLTYDKSEQKNIHKTQLGNHKAITYAFNDVDRLLDLFKDLYIKLRDVGSIKSYLLHCDYIQALAYMEQCGLPLNYDYWKNKCDNDLLLLEEKRLIVEEYIYENLPEFRDNQLDLFSSHKNLSISTTSPKQMIKVFKALNINCKDDKGKDTIDKSVIGKSDHPFIKLWMDFVDINHDVTTYGYNLLELIEDDTIYTTFNPVLDTARISTRKEGINILNFPANEKTRECVRPHKGYKIIVSDYEGQENSCGADLHQDTTMVASLKEGLDLHCAFARMIFPELEDLTDSEITKSHKDKRNYSKSPRFLFSYGGNAYSLYTNNGIPLEESNRLEKLYKELHSGIYSWGETVFKKACQTGYIESADGFKLYLPYFDQFEGIREWYSSVENDRSFWNKYSLGKKIENGERECLSKSDSDAVDCYRQNRSSVSEYFKTKSKYFKLCLNNPVQTTAAHQTKRAAVMLFQHIKDNKHLGRVKIVNIPHDEFVLEVEEALVDQYKKILEQCMIEGGNYYLQSGVVDSMKAEANSGDSWYEAK